MNDISLSIKEVDGFEVLTHNGFKKFDKIMKTIELRKFIVFFTSGRKIECADTHKFIDIEFDEIYAKDLEIGDLIISNDEIGFDEIYDIIDTKEYINMYDIQVPDGNLYYTNNILSHNSLTMANFAARQVLHGHNPVLMTLEMSEDAFAQRFDSIFSLLDINRIYVTSEYKNNLVRRLKDIKENTENLGNLYIKQFATGQASIREFRIYLRELIMRGIKPSILYADYINLMKSAYSKNQDLYSSVKKIAEELRALSFEFEVPVMSVSQLNREGGFVGFEELSFNYIAESLGLPATADFMAIYGVDEDELIYQSEMHYKIVKNRLGGRVGEFSRFYCDVRNLKLYDSSELDLWMEESQISGDSRERAESATETRRRR